MNNLSVALSALLIRLRQLPPSPEADAVQDTYDVLKRLYMDRVRAAENMVLIQGTDGNWDQGEYMLGMFNGMLIIQNVFTDKYADTPPFRSAPERARTVADDNQIEVLPWAVQHEDGVPAPQTGGNLMAAATREALDRLNTQINAITDASVSSRMETSPCERIRLTVTVREDGHALEPEVIPTLQAGEEI